MVSYSVIRSKRKSISIRVEREGNVTVRAPLYTSDKEIEKLIKANEERIIKMQKKLSAEALKQKPAEPFSEEEIDDLKEQAKKVIPERVRYYAEIMGVTWNSVHIKCQKTRWGSCSSKKNLNFNCLLMKVPPNVLDSVVVHELCHLKQMNHGPKFYGELYRIFPDYDRCRKWLKKNGPELQRKAFYGK